MPDKDRKEMSNVPSLVDLCVQTAIDNVRYLGDVGGVGEQLLERILPHCDVDQLKHIEDCSEVRESRLRVYFFEQGSFGWIYCIFSFAGNRP